MKPVSKAGVLFACPEHTEFDPARTLTYPPRPESCCKVSSKARHLLMKTRSTAAAQAGGC